MKNPSPLIMKSVDRPVLWVEPWLKLVVMSATLDAALLKNYLAPCEVLTSQGRTFPVHVEYLPKSVDFHPVSSRPIHGLPFSELFGTTFTGANLASYGYLPPQLTSDLMTIFLRLLGPLAVGCTVLVLALHRPLTNRWMVAAAGALGSLTYPLLVEIQVWVSSNEYFPNVVMRYGVSLVPLLIASIAIAADDKKMKRTMVAFTIAAALVALYTVYNPLNAFPTTPAT